jgi:hypothetical protein
MNIIYDEKLDKFIEFQTDQEFELSCYYIYNYYDKDFNSQEFIDSLYKNSNKRKRDTNQKNIRNIKVKYY